VQWLRDGLGIIDSASRPGNSRKQADPTQEVYLVPAFTGLGAPHWDADARGAIFGLTRNTGPAEFARAALEASATRRATCSTRCTRTGRAAWKARCCASMAAWSPPTGRCSGSPTSSTRRSIGR
jgi:sugar (pentulose or hexulose) kinase